jgi:hypothetical protein
MAELAVACETSQLGVGLRDWFATQSGSFWHEAAVSGIEAFCEQLVLVTVMVPALRDELVSAAEQLGAGS